MNAHAPRKALKTRSASKSSCIYSADNYSYRASPRSLRPVYTGGPVLISKDGQWLITTLEEQVLISEVQTGLQVARVRGDTTPITSLSLSYHTSPPTLITCHQSTSIRQYPLPSTASSSLQVPYLTYSRQIPKAHSAPILVSAVSPDSTLFATGSSDGTVKVWDSAGGYVTHLFRGHGGPVSALRFSQPPSGGGKMLLFTGSTDSRIRIYDLHDQKMAGPSKPKHVLEGHVSVVRGIDLSEDGRWLVSAGRDKVVLLWDMNGEVKQGKEKGKKGEPRLVQTVIVQEQVEAVGWLRGTILGKNGMMCFTGGEKGVVRIWDVAKGVEVGSMVGVEGVDTAEVDEDEQRGIIDVLYDQSSSSLISIHADQNIIFNSLTDGSPTRRVVGFNDEIIDAVFLSSPTSSSHSHLALATNSNLIRMYSTSTFDARLLSGHKDIVLCLGTSIDHRLLVSGSKDSTARLWYFTPSSPNSSPSSQSEWRCIASCEGHAESIGAVALSRKLDETTGFPKFLITASQDRTAKLWDLSSLSSTGDDDKPKSLATLRIHEKDINSLDISPNDRFLASGSQDKLVKIFEIDYTSSAGGTKGALKLVGTCKGHRRGVWTVKFSKVDRIVASGAADRSVKLWSLDDFTCLKTFEGHTNSVLRIDFLSQGMQLITSSSDGLVKLWNIRDEECVKTLDNHEDKVWALAISQDERTIVSAGADSVATFWEDATEMEQEEANAALVKSVQIEQDYTNYLSIKDYRRAILLALAMSQPGRLYNLFSSVISSSSSSSLSTTSTSTSLNPSISLDPSNSSNSNKPTESLTGSKEIDMVIQTLSLPDLSQLLLYVSDWNTHSRTSTVSQIILYAILQLRTPEEIIQSFNRNTRNGMLSDGGKKDMKKEINMRDLLDGLIPYSERHFSRLDRLVQDTYVLDYILGEMDGVVGQDMVNEIGDVVM
ncbi:hypothetical protein TREMEDRAFT_42066 [Tremella mesenterica DSM 1558]|uniref:uncharacterized protein n=1 Tax=Tremella mesenterica (strain ATCC 24925 / CBS 8224 / DSM 1558 / NBRC 9311 / NRRL Y-6157 / RJB 2259-6 / UBC 559-6) TaxID=578456 RepID=UPI0003F4A237|nr:uncharacterized protein TREMEDRAFT_42066 [Tremella mesenterica DSM 1558]EIW72892.1 hypothetical protein TREMEDRAFT_42066 [Tremella mesenterica DSM 1558]